MKMYNAPTIETVELEFVDVIATSGGDLGMDTSAYDLKETALNGNAITNTNKGAAWQNNWN